MVEKISRLSFFFALLSILVALIFSLLRNTTLAEHAGVVTYICMVLGVVTMVVDELRTTHISIKEDKKHSHKQTMRRRSV